MAAGNYTRDHTNHSLRVCSLFISIYLETFTSYGMFECGIYARDHSGIPVVFCENSIMKELSWLTVGSQLSCIMKELSFVKKASWNFFCTWGEKDTFADWVESGCEKWYDWVSVLLCRPHAVSCAHHIYIYIYIYIYTTCYSHML